MLRIPALRCHEFNPSATRCIKFNSDKTLSVGSWACVVKYRTGAIHVVKRWALSSDLSGTAERVLALIIIFTIIGPWACCPDTIPSKNPKYLTFTVMPATDPGCGIPFGLFTKASAVVHLEP